MSDNRPAITACTAAALVVLLAGAAAPAADAPAPRPVVRMTAKVWPGRKPIPRGAPLRLRLDTTFSSDPAGGDLVLARADYLFGRGARFNGRIFPSCSVARLRAAHGRLTACPQGSKVGSGVASGRAVAVGVSSSGKLTIFNGPGGRSLTLNMLVVHPALIDATFSAPLRRVHGRYAFKLSTIVPPELQTILDGDVVVTRISVTTGATRTIGGRRRGYFEATACPKHGGSAVHGDFRFRGGQRATTDLSVVC